MMCHGFSLALDLTPSCDLQQAQPALLLNHDNDFLHYQDDWYIVAYKPNEYAFVYYKGNNDAWKGYGGAVIYTRYSPKKKHFQS